MDRREVSRASLSHDVSVLTMPERSEWSSEIAAWILESKATRQRWQRLAQKRFYSSLSLDDCDDVVQAAARSLQKTAKAKPSGTVCDAWGKYKDGDSAHIEAIVTNTLYWRASSMVKKKARLAEDDMPEGLQNDDPGPIGSPEAYKRLGEWLSDGPRGTGDVLRFLYVMKILGIKGDEIPVGFSSRYRSADEALASFRVHLSPGPEKQTEWFEVLDRMVEGDTPSELMTYCNLTDGQYGRRRASFITKFRSWLPLNQVDFENREGGLS